GAGAQDRERVVPDAHAPRPAAARHGRVDALLLVREVHAAEQHLRHGRPAPVEAGAVDELLQHGRTAVEAEVVRRAERAARVRDQRPVRLDEREVGLRVAAVDGEDHASTSAAIRSSSCSAIAYWTTSGCASSAFFTSSSSRLSAAVAARRSYAAVCWTSPSSSGASGA